MEKVESELHEICLILLIDPCTTTVQHKNQKMNSTSGD